MPKKENCKNLAKAFLVLFIACPASPCFAQALSSGRQPAAISSMAGNTSVYLPEVSGNGHALTWDGRIMITRQSMDGGRVPVWRARVFRPEKLLETIPVDRTDLTTKFRGSWSPATVIAFNKIYDREGLEPQALRLNYHPNNIESLNGLAVFPVPGSGENPYRSSSSGARQINGDHLSYELEIFAHQQLRFEAITENSHMVRIRLKVTVENPYSSSAKVVKATGTGNLTTLLDINGNRIEGIEPTITFDGRLLVYQRFGNLPDNSTLYYTFNNDPTRTDRWSVPRSIHELFDDPNPELKQRYALARYPARLAFGNRITNPIIGAYPWISLDGNDLFFTAVRIGNGTSGAVRAAQTVIGASSKGLIRQLDGAFNHSRYGETRLFMSSLGRTPGMWSPLELMARKVLPLTDKLFTYMMFASNHQRYFEASFEETVVGGYEAYYEMNEALQGNGAYALGLTPDVSGEFRAAQLQNNAKFPEEAIGTRAQSQALFGIDASGNPLIAPCENSGCASYNPETNSPIIFSGKGMFFTENARLVAANISPITGRGLLQDARQLTASAAIYLMAPASELNDGFNHWRNIVRKDGVFRLVLEESGAVQGRVYVKPPGQQNVIELASGQIQLPSTQPVRGVIRNQWAPIAMTYDVPSATMEIYLHGQLGIRKKFPGYENAPLNYNENYLIIGHGNRSETPVFILDQVGVSRVRRSVDEILRQANFVRRRTRHPNTLASTPLPRGLALKDMRADVYAFRAANTALVDLGKHLFFDRRLSSDSRRSCASCHSPGRAFATNTPLETNRLAEIMPQKLLLRNAPSLANLALKEALHSDGSHFTLESQAEGVISNAMEMGPSLAAVASRIRTSPQYKALFAAAARSLADDASVGATITDALREFQLTLIAGNSRFDRLAETPLAANEERGRQLFFGRARCAECHSGTNFSNGTFHNLNFISALNSEGVMDYGQAKATYSGAHNFRHRTPSLRDVALTAPYFHNGSAATLEQAVQAYTTISLQGNNAGTIDDSLVKVDINPEDVRDLVAFLESLTSEQNSYTITPPNYTDPLPPSPPAALDFFTDDNKDILITHRGTRQIRFGIGSFEINGNGTLTVRTENGSTRWRSPSPVRTCSLENPCRMRFHSNGTIRLYQGSENYWSQGPTVPAQGPFKLRVRAGIPVRIMDGSDRVVYESR